ncbi:MAG TPA: YaiI/YqxD family protein [bacterium]
MRIWIDADACPRVVKEVVFKAALRLQIPTTLVANQPIGYPRSTLVNRVTVGKEIDAADQHIAANATPGDVVVTADIPLAAKLVAQGVVAIDPRGTVYSTANVQEALATRNLMQELREAGVAEGGPAPLGPKDRERFANALDRELTRLLRVVPAKPAR